MRLNPTRRCRRLTNSRPRMKGNNPAKSLSCHRFRANEVRLQLSVLAYTLGNLWRRLVLPKHIHSWSLTSLQQRLVKTGGRLVKHARYYWLLLAESHLTRRLFAEAVVELSARPSAISLYRKR